MLWRLPYRIRTLLKTPMTQVGDIPSSAPSALPIETPANIPLIQERVIPKPESSPLAKLLPEWLTFLLIMALAAALRLYSIDTLPPGLHGDEGVYGYFATQVLEGYRPIFFALPDGREPLFIYTIALAFSVFGTSALVIRLVAVTYGILTVAATYLFSREVFGRRIATIATLTLAITYWHVNLSRLGYRAGIVPLFICLAVYFLWRGVRRGEWWSYTLAGAFVGLDLYTYISARIVPFWLGLFVLLLFIPSWRLSISVKRHLIGVVLFVSAAIVVFSPLGMYFLEHPEAFAVRTQSVGLTSGSEDLAVQAADYGQNALKTAGLFFVQGDGEIRHNLPGRPAFDGVLAIGFLIGFLLVIRHLNRPAYFLLFLWLFMMLLPGALSSHAPHYLRTAGVLPAAVTIVAVGLDALWRLGDRWPGRLPTLILRGLIVVGLAFSLRSTANDYFVNWASLSGVTYAFHADETTAPCLASQLSAEGPSLIASPPHISSLITQKTCPSQAVPARRFDGLKSLIIPVDAVGKNLNYVYPRITTPTNNRHCELLGCEDPIATVRDFGGGIAVQAYQIPGASLLWQKLDKTLTAKIGPNLEVLGYNLDRRFTPGSSIRLTLFSKITNTEMEPGDWKLFANLLGEDGRKRAGSYGETLMPESWRSGDIYVAWLDIPTTDDLDSGLYRIEFGVFDNDSYRRQPIVDGKGEAVGDALSSDPLRALPISSVASSDTPPKTIARFGNGIELVGYDLPHDRLAEAGDELNVTLRWRSGKTIETDYTVFVQLLDGSGKLVAQSDSLPDGGKLPTILWTEGELVSDRHIIPIDASLRGQELRLIVGMYESQSHQRLIVYNPDTQRIDDFIELTSIRVK